MSAALAMSSLPSFWPRASRPELVNWSTASLVRIKVTPKLILIKVNSSKKDLPSERQTWSICCRQGAVVEASCVTSLGSGVLWEHLTIELDQI